MMQRQFSKVITYLSFVVILMLNGNELIFAQETTAANNMIGKSVIGSGGVLHSSGNNHFHSATAGEVFVGGMSNTKYFIYSGFWALSSIVATHVENNLSDGMPCKYQLYQNYPNPFNPTTTIEYDIPELSTVNIEIYNIAGQRVRHLIKSKIDEPGYKEIVWDGRNDNGNIVTSGAYFYCVIIMNNQATAQENGIHFQQTKKMLFIK